MILRIIKHVHIVTNFVSHGINENFREIKGPALSCSLLLYGTKGLRKNSTSVGVHMYAGSSICLKASLKDKKRVGWCCPAGIQQPLYGGLKGW
jgi:hypothetical protein